MRLDIIGSVASGKTTLARELSEAYHVSFYEKDNIVWKRTTSGDKKRDEGERDKLFQEIIIGKNWIVEGSPRKILRESFVVCDYIILLDVPMHIRLARMIRRWIRQRAGKEKYNSKPTVKFLYYNLMWIFEYNKDRKKLIKSLSEYGEKYQRFTTAEDAKNFIRKVYT